MSIEHYILKSFAKDKKVFLKFYPLISHVKVDTMLDKLLNTISNYYLEFEEHEYISQDELVAYLDILNPHLKDRDIYVDIIKLIYDVDVSDSIAEVKIKQLIEKDAANKITQICIPTLSGETYGILDDLKAIITETEDILGLNAGEDNLFLKNDIAEIISKSDSQGLEWKLDCFNESLGPLAGMGNIIHVASRPNAGKTTLLSSEMTHMCQQLAGNESILWVHNEEDGSMVQRRWYQAMCNATQEQIDTNVTKAQELFEERGGMRMHMHSNDSVTIEQIEKLIIETEPRIVVVDIADHVGFRGDHKVGNGAEKLKVLYRHFRNLGKRYSSRFPIDFILTGWSDASTEGKKWFGQNHLDGGKTGKPGSTDAIITIGQDGTGEGTARYISVVRNKLKGKSMRKVVTIDPFRARFIE